MSDPRAEVWQIAGVVAALARTDHAGALARARLDEVGVACILLKGRAFASRLYDHVWERPYSDTDLLVRPADLRSAAQVLVSMGYTRVDRDQDRLGLAGHAHTYVNDAGAIIDLHWNVPGVGGPAEETWNLLLVESEPQTVGGHEARVPSEAATALIVALHAAHHGGHWNTARTDLARAGEQFDRVVWARALEFAHRLQAVDAFTGGLTLAPEGRAVAVSLDLLEGATLEYRLRAEPPDYPVWAVHRVRTAQGWRRLAVLLEVVVPPPRAMRLHHPETNRGVGWLLVAYLARPVRLIRLLPSAQRAYRRAARSPTVPADPADRPFFEL